MCRSTVPSCPLAMGLVLSRTVTSSYGSSSHRRENPTLLAHPNSLVERSNSRSFISWDLRRGFGFNVVSTATGCTKDSPPPSRSPRHTRRSRLRLRYRQTPSSRLRVDLATRLDHRIQLSELDLWQWLSRSLLARLSGWARSVENPMTFSGQPDAEPRLLVPTRSVETQIYQRLASITSVRSMEV